MGLTKAKHDDLKKRRLKLEAKLRQLGYEEAPIERRKYNLLVNLYAT